METETIKTMAVALAFGSFMAIFVVYTVHARKVVCRAALAAFLASILLYTGVDHGALGVLTVSVVLGLSPLAVGLVAWAVMNVMKSSIERQYQASTGVTHPLIGTIADVYQVIWASDHG